MRALVTFSMISVLSAVALASEDAEVSGALSLLQVRATHHVDRSGIGCVVEVETSEREHAGTSTGASIQLQNNIPGHPFHGAWSTARNFPRNIAEGQVLVKNLVAPARPTGLRINAGGNNAWGYTKVSLVCQGETIFVLEGDDNYSGDSRFWVDGNQEAPATQEYQIPETNPPECVVEVETSTREHGGTATGARAQLQVGGVWTAPLNFPLNIAEGETVATTEFVSARPSALKIAAGGSNAWGYTRLSVTCDGESVLTLNGDEEYGASARFWVDGNQEAPETQEYGIPAATTTTPVQDEASAVGDPHIITSSGRSYDLVKLHKHSQ